MASSTTVKLHIGNAIPPAGTDNTDRIIRLWHTISSFFDQRPFEAQSGLQGHARAYRISLDCSSLVQTMERAQSQSGSFNKHRRAHIEHPESRIDAELAITITGQEGDPEEQESYQVATVFLQQLTLATSITHPGAFQVLSARFTGEGAHRFEAQEYDAGILHGARRAAAANEWPRLENPELATVWDWLEETGVAQADTAIRDINRALFTLLKVAQQRHEYSARTVLLLVYQLEVLLDCRKARSLAPLRNRAQMILGPVPEAADCFAELLEVRDSLFLANQPVHRPPLVCYDTAVALRQQIGQHNSAVEAGTAVVLALLQDLVAHKSQSYRFSEQVSRR